MEQKSLWTYFIECFTLNYFNFSGRARRREFWGFVLFNTLMSLFLLIVSIIVMSDDLRAVASLQDGANVWAFVLGLVKVMMLLMLYGLITLPATLGVVVRRLHDTGRSGWWYGAYLLLANVGYPMVLLLSYATESAWVSLLVLPLYLGILGLGVTIFVFTLLDSQRGTNRWGVSPKYPEPIPYVSAGGEATGL